MPKDETVLDQRIIIKIVCLRFQTSLGNHIYLNYSLKFSRPWSNNILKNI